METTEKPQESQMMAKPQKEHQWLQQLLGEWTFESEVDCGPGQPPMKTQGVESVQSIGDLWIMGHGKGEMPGGGEGKMVLTLGFDPQKNRYVGTWIGSMMTHLWIYDGEMDASGRILTLTSEGPSMAGDGKMATYQDIIEIKGPDHRTLSSRAQGEDGKWQHFMTAHYRRKK